MPRCNTILGKVVHNLIYRSNLQREYSLGANMCKLFEKTLVYIDVQIMNTRIVRALRIVV